MDDSALQHRLSSIERRLNLALVLLVIPYVLGVAELLGYWKVGVFATAIGVVALVLSIAYRRRNHRSPAQ